MSFLLEVGGLGFCLIAPGSMPKEEARNKKEGVQSTPTSPPPTPCRPIVVVGLLIKSQRVQLFIPNDSTCDRTL
jgi:hypothetical protein